MSGGVFISYRRDNSPNAAGRIYDRLRSRLGSERVFFDIDSIRLGADFVEVLSSSVGKCDALVVVIGRNWASSASNKNRRRLEDPNDFVRLEIEAALERGVPVIPVLVDEAEMPRTEDLPDGLKKLTRRNGIQISHARFDSDVDRLTSALSSLEDEIRQRQEREHQETVDAAERTGQARRVTEEVRATAPKVKDERKPEQVRPTVVECPTSGPGPRTGDDKKASEQMEGAYVNHQNLKSENWWSERGTKEYTIMNWWSDQRKIWRWPSN